MNYTEIKALALSYMDETGTEATANMDNFIKMVESRINRLLAVQKQVVESTTEVVAVQSMYGLPSDFSGVRDIELYTPPDGAKTTLHYYSPEQMNNNVTGSPAYTILADQFEISPVIEGQVIKIAYYQRVPNLNGTDNSNWMSEDNPDAYVFGLMVELSSFKKDAQAAELWNIRFREALSDISTKDEAVRWSGTALTIRTG